MFAVKADDEGEEKCAKRRNTNDPNSSTSRQGMEESK